MKKSGWILVGIGALLAAFAAIIRAVAFFPKPRQLEQIHNLPDAPLLQAGQPLKVMTFNVPFSTTSYQSTRKDSFTLKRQTNSYYGFSTVQFAVKI